MKAFLSIFMLLAFGTGVWGYTPSPEQIAKWKEAAENGEAAAQFNLGAAYDFGQGVAEDDTEAVKWYRKAAEQGHAQAQYNLGIMYDNGDGGSGGPAQPDPALERNPGIPNEWPISVEPGPFFDS